MSSYSEMYLFAVSGLFVCFGFALVARSLGPTRLFGIAMKGGWDAALMALGVILALVNLALPDTAVGFRANPYWALAVAAVLAVVAFFIRLHRINRGEVSGRKDSM